jgi:hypothetical protein
MGKSALFQKKVKTDKINIVIKQKTSTTLFPGATNLMQKLLIIPLKESLLFGFTVN